MRHGERILVSFRHVEALPHVLEGVGRFVRQRGLRWQVHCVDVDDFARTLRAGAVDGAMTVIPRRAAAEVARARRSRVPIVNLLHDLTPAVPSVLSDDAAIGARAARYFLDRGFRHVAYVGFDSAWSRDRQRGLADALRRAGVASHACPAFADAIDYRAVCSPRGEARIAAWLARLPAPVGVVACCDRIALAVLAAAARASRAVPEDVAVLGVDDLVSTCELASVPLSSVAQDFVAMGTRAAHVLSRAIAGHPPRARATRVPPGEVATRRSTDVLAFPDATVAGAMRLIHASAATDVETVARELAVSRRWLDARFKLAVGHTPAEAIRRARLAAVTERLLRSDLSIGRIATLCRFSCPENLIRFFKDATGLPPQRFRERHRAAR